MPPLSPYLGLPPNKKTSSMHPPSNHRHTSDSYRITPYSRGGHTHSAGSQKLLNLPPIIPPQQPYSNDGLSSLDFSSETYDTFPERSHIGFEVNLRNNQHSEYSNDKVPIVAWLGDSSSTGALMGPGSRLADGHPTHPDPHHTVYSQDSSDIVPTMVDATTIETASVNSAYYDRSATASWQGSPHIKSAHLDYSMHRLPTPSPTIRGLINSPGPHSDSEWGNHKYANPTVNPAEVNSQSAGASRDVENGDEDHYNNNGPQISIYVNHYDHSLPPQPQEVQMSTTPRIDHADRRARNGHGSGRSDHHSGAFLKPPPACGTRPGSSRKPQSRKQNHKVTKSQPQPKGNSRRQTTGNTSQRPFLCTFYFADCQQTFATKNEWKRHVSSQHLQTNIWRCDFTACSERKAATFNRKDLFGQHLKRMHAPPEEQYSGQPGRSSKQKKNHGPQMQHFLNSEIPKIQDRCKRIRRNPPERSECGFCRQVFEGTGSWDERMEHVGRHYENAAASGENVAPENWVMDAGLIRYSLQEGER
ncbi:hypothetical protein K440DRAFT_85093 [Wilcoxina mikolae CBS 423.85]|nr:hypothetical protein K440DRAFT_85093 [Wilcoxina mikolae CBS 423.85]